MPERISRGLYRLAKLPLVLICLLVFLIFSATQLPAQSAQAAAYSADAGTPDTSFFYTPAELNRMAERFGSSGRQAYIRARFTFDLVFPLVYGAFLATSLSFLLGRSLDEASPWRRLNLIPLAAVLLDLLENASAALVMAVYPAPQPLAAALAAIATPLKWVFVGGSFALLPPAAWISLRKRGS
jgi:hypothetical protein